MSSRLFVLAVVAVAIVITPPARAVTITFEVLPDGTPIQGQGPGICGEIMFDSFRPWGVLFTAPEGDSLNIVPTLGECLSPPNGLGLCSQNGTLSITFVRPGTNTSTVVSEIDIAMFTRTHSPWYGQINVYDAAGVLLESWVLPNYGFCREPPFFYGYHHFSATARIARVECILQYTMIDNLTATEASTPVDGSTWGRIKAFYP